MHDLLELLMHLFFGIQNLQYWKTMVGNYRPIWVMFFKPFLQYSQSYSFLYCFITLLRLFFSFLHTRSLLVLYAYVSTKSIDFILLSSFELKELLLISSVKTLCLSLLNLFCAFNISFFTNSFWSPLRLSTLIFIFFLNSYFTLYSSCF